MAKVLVHASKAVLDLSAGPEVLWECDVCRGISHQDLRIMK